jgi:hypothetical protein
MLLQILLLIGILLYITFIILIFIGSGFITKILFYSNNQQLACIGLNNTNELNIAKMTIVLFWIVFTPLCILPLVLCSGYYKYIF